MCFQRAEATNDDLSWILLKWAHLLRNWGSGICVSQSELSCLALIRGDLFARSMSNEVIEAIDGFIQNFINCEEKSVDSDKTLTWSSGSDSENSDIPVWSLKVVPGHNVKSRLHNCWWLISNKFQMDHYQCKWLPGWPYYFCFCCCCWCCCTL